MNDILAAQAKKAQGSLKKLDPSKALMPLAKDPQKALQAFSAKQQKAATKAVQAFIAEKLKALQAFIMNPPSKKEHYVAWGNRYIAKKLLLIIVAACIILPILFYVYALPLLVRQFGTPTFVEGKEPSKYTGRAKIITVDKKPLYSGRLQEGLRQGVGELYDRGRLVYRGGFAEGLAAGQGTEYGEDGKMVYKGSFAAGQRDGAGVEYYPGGEKKKYEGTFKGGTYDGTGTEYYPGEAKKYTGSFLAGEYSGNGTLYWANGSLLYQGLFENGKYSGQGVLYQDNQKLYEGGFQQGLYTGPGKLYYRGGSLEYSGGFDSGKYAGSGILFDTDGSMIYEGAFMGGQYHGEGKLYEDSKLRYEGSFAQGGYSGRGKLYDTVAGGLSYEGEFVDNKFNGQGKLYNTAGKVIYDGVFCEDWINYGYVLNLPVADVRKTFANETEAIMPEDTNSFYIVSRDMEACVLLDYNSDQTDYTAQELFVWGEHNVLGVSPGTDRQQADEILGAAVSEGFESVSPDLQKALGLENVGQVQYTEYVKDNYLVRFYFADTGGKWLYAGIKTGSGAPRPK